MVNYVKSIKFGEEGTEYAVKDSEAQSQINEILEGDLFVKSQQSIEDSGKALVINEEGIVEPSSIEIPSLDGYATEQYVQEQIEGLDIPSIEGLASEQYVNNAIEGLDIPSIEGLASEQYVNSAVEGLASEQYVQEQIEALDIPSLDGYATEQYVASAIEALDIPSIEGLASEEYVSQNYVAKSNSTIIEDAADETELVEKFNVLLSVLRTAGLLGRSEPTGE